MQEFTSRTGCVVKIGVPARGQIVVHLAKFSDEATERRLEFLRQDDGGRYGGALARTNLGEQPEIRRQIGIEHKRRTLPRVSAVRSRSMTMCTRDTKSSALADTLQPGTPSHGRITAACSSVPESGRTDADSGPEPT